MPIVSIKIATGRSTEQKRNLVQTIINAVVGVLDIKPEWVTVLSDEIYWKIRQQVVNFMLISLARGTVKWVQNRI